VRTMETDNTIDNRIRARDTATRMLNRLTAGVGLSAIAGVAVLGAVSAYTIPGLATYTQGATASTSTSTGTSSSSSSSLQSSSTPVSSTTSSGVAVSGGS
jgi:hypothetical protein